MLIDSDTFNQVSALFMPVISACGILLSNRRRQKPKVITIETDTRVVECEEENGVGATSSIAGG